MVELRHVLGDVRMTAYPVILDSLHLERWWEEPSTMRLLVSEFFKYLAAIMRIHVIEPHLPWLLDKTAARSSGG